MKEGARFPSGPSLLDELAPPFARDEPSTTVELALSYYLLSFRSRAHLKTDLSIFLR